MDADTVDFTNDAEMPKELAEAWAKALVKLHAKLDSHRITHKHLTGECPAHDLAIFTIGRSLAKMSNLVVN